MWQFPQSSGNKRWISKWNPNVCVSTVCTGSVQNLWVRSDINAWNFKYNFKNVKKKTCFNWSSNPQCYYRSKTTIMICYTRPQTCFQFQMSLTSVSVMRLRNTSPKFWVWLESLEFSCKLLDHIRTSIGFWNSQKSHPIWSILKALFAKNRSNESKSFRSPRCPRCDISLSIAVSKPRRAMDFLESSAVAAAQNPKIC